MKKLFVLMDWWKDCVAREKFKFPNTVPRVEKNIQKLQNKVVNSNNSDWYVPTSSHFVGNEYTKHSIKYQPQSKDYDEIYVFGMSLGACVLMSKFGYCHWPEGKRFIIKDCSIQETFGPDGVITDIYEYQKYLCDREIELEDSEEEHNKQVERDIDVYSKQGAAWVHKTAYIKEPHRFSFEKDSLYEPIKFRSLDEIYSII
jgi:esterase/lipase|tara:strand:+ start:809 stop:1411 length:603 start_codon:yes stop_codon:yes gene_type:complete